MTTTLRTMRSMETYTRKLWEEMLFRTMQKANFLTKFFHKLWIADHFEGPAPAGTERVFR
jgi:hypothetical protein